MTTFKALLTTGMILLIAESSFAQMTMQVNGGEPVKLSEDQSRNVMSLLFLGDGEAPGKWQKRDKNVSYSADYSVQLSDELSIIFAVDSLYSRPITYFMKKGYVFTTSPVACVEQAIEDRENPGKMMGMVMRVVIPKGIEGDLKNLNVTKNQRAELVITTKNLFAFSGRDYLTSVVESVTDHGKVIGSYVSADYDGISPHLKGSLREYSDKTISCDTLRAQKSQEKK